MSRASLGWFLALCAIAAAGTYAAHIAELRVRHALAAQCAHHSPAAECAARFDLEVNE